MPNRIIKESINESRGLSDCSFFTQDLFKRLITYADDYGRFNADTQIMLARLYPREIDVITHDDIISSLIELCGVGKVAFYTSTPRSEVYGCFPNWPNHQRIRDSKNKCPDPTDTSVNDWYYRRFISMEMKIWILQRDNCKCQICSKDLNPEKASIKRLIKFHTNTIHFDHIVPCGQGGRATLENIQTTCSKCNLSRKRFYIFDEILQFSLTGIEPLEVAASCGELRPNPIQSNPIRIQSESNPNIPSTPLFSKKGKPKDEPLKIKYYEAEFVTLTEQEHAKLIEMYGEDRAKRMVIILDNYKGSNGKKYASDYRTILSWVVDREAKENPAMRPITEFERINQQNSINPKCPRCKGTGQYKDRLKPTEIDIELGLPGAEVTRGCKCSEAINQFNDTG